MPPQQGAAEQPLVMVVENDGDVREIVAEVLSMRGVRALLAEHGAAALEQLSRGARPRVILLDLTMPVMDGWTFLDVKERTPDIAGIPVVVMSALPTDAMERDRRWSGVMQKPVSLDQLLATVERYARA